MRRARYQSGTVELSPRSRGAAVWVYRWRENGPQGKRTHKSAIIGSVEKFKTRAQALKAAEEQRARANRETSEDGEPTFGMLIERFIADERLRELRARTRAVGMFAEDEVFDGEEIDPSTASSYLSMLDVHIRPRWGALSISE